MKKIYFKKIKISFFFPKNKINSEEYFKEINQYQNTESSDKIICFITIQESNREQIDIISYPIIPEDLLIYQTNTSFPTQQNNQVINSIVRLFKKKFSVVKFHSFPFISIINTIYPAIYIIISTKNSDNASIILQKIKTLNN